MINEKHLRVFEYADDMALVGLRQKTNLLGEAAYLALITAVQTWYHTSQLEINAAKTKELIICSKLDLKFDPISLDGHC